MLGEIAHSFFLTTVFASLPTHFGLLFYLFSLKRFERTNFPSKDVIFEDYSVCILKRNGEVCRIPIIFLKNYCEESLALFH